MEKYSVYKRGYEDGYFKALMDFDNFLGHNNLLYDLNPNNLNNQLFKSSKQLKLAIQRSLEILLMNNLSRDRFMKVGEKTPITLMWNNGDDLKFDENTKVFLFPKFEKRKEESK